MPGDGIPGFENVISYLTNCRLGRRRRIEEAGKGTENRQHLAPFIDPINGKLLLVNVTCRCLYAVKNPSPQRPARPAASRDGQVSCMQTPAPACRRANVRSRRAWLA